ncbi:MAG: transcriptional regulator NrdR [Acidobacteria bacterium]|nr:transcriptional regulator NrdR [Acidobacteriota bacterium]
MKCPFCGYLEDKVVDSRESREGEAIRRRRECLRCERRFTSYERIDEIPYMVVKKDGRRETFDRNKVMAGLLRACEKRPVPSSKLDAIVNAIEKYVQESSERERPTSKVKADQVHIGLTNTQLRLWGHKKRRVPRNRIISHLCSERSYGRFSRIVPLRWTVSVRDARAQLENGILLIRLPKIEDRRGAEFKLAVKEAAEE